MNILYITLGITLFCYIVYPIIDEIHEEIAKEIEIYKYNKERKKRSGKIY